MANQTNHQEILNQKSIRQWFWFCFLLGMAIIYLPGLGNQPVFDDNVLSDGRVFSQYGSLLEFKARMLSYGSFVWLQDGLGEGWWKQRLLNLLLHSGVVAGIWVLLRGLLPLARWPEAADSEQPGTEVRELAAALGVLLFALNPVAVYAVAYLVQRSILMATLFSVWTLVAVMLAARRQQPAWLLLALVAYLLAMLSKEYALLLPLPAMALYMIVQPPSRKQFLVFSVAVVLVLGISAYLLVQRYDSILGTPFDDISRAYLASLEQMQPGVEERAWLLSIINQSWLFFKYGFLWILPNIQWLAIDLRPEFPLSITSFPHILGPLLFSGLLILSLLMMWRWPDWRRYAGFALFFPLAMFSTEFATIWIQDPFVLYRSYLWAITLPMLIALPLLEMQRKTVLVTGAVLCVILAALSFNRVRSMSDEYSVWKDAVDTLDLQAPANAVGRPRALMNLGTEYMSRQLFTLAAESYSKAITLGEYSGQAYYQLGNALQASGQLEQALAAQQRADQAIGPGPLAPLVAWQKGKILAQLQRPGEALDALDKTVEAGLEKEFIVELRSLRARLNSQTGRLEAALEDYQYLAQQEPENLQYPIQMAMLHNALGIPDKALSILARLDQDNVNVLIAHAIVYTRLGRLPEALEHAEAAARLAPDNPQVKGLLQNLRTTLSGQ